MQIVRDLAGYSMGRSDLVRRAMSKKKHDVMAREKEIFIHGQEENGKVVVPGCVRNGVSEAAATRLFDEMTAFASYAFNKSHAAAYAVVAVQTAWLKLKFPVEFMTAMMNSMNGNTGKIAFYIQYCRRKGIAILPPDVNRSEEKFTVDGGGIRFGLAGVKSLGHNAIEALVAERRGGGDYRDIYDFCQRLAGAALNKKGVEALIRAGAMDALPGNRAGKLYTYERAMDGAARTQKVSVAGQISLFGMMDEQLAPPPPMPNMPDFSRLARLQMEKEITGVYITGHPLDDYAHQLARLPISSQTLAELAEAPDGGMSWDQKKVRMGGIISELKQKVTKSGGLMAFVTLEDMYGATEVLVFPKVYEREIDTLREDAAVVVTGRLSVREDEAPKLLMDRVAPLQDLDAIPEAPLPRGAVSQRLTEGSAPLPGGAVTQSVTEGSAPLPRGAVSQRLTEGSRKLYLKLTTDQRGPVLNILKQTPGPIRVMLYMSDEKKTYQAPRQYWVGEGYDFGALANLLGPDAIVLK